MTRNLKIVFFLAAFAGFGAMAGAWHLGFGFWPPTGLSANGRPVAFPPADLQGCFKAQALALFGDQRSAYHWSECRQVLASTQALNAYTLRRWGVVVSGLIGLVALFGFAFAVRSDRSPLKVIRGSRLLAGSAGLRAFARACAEECKLHGRGVELVPGVPLGRERETRHFLIMGSVGGGKTQTMLHLIDGALQRGDGLLILDTKGDMMAGLPGAPEPLLVAPHDQRSMVWDIAADCRVKQDARELAARFIPDSPDPMWSLAAREIFVACLAHLQDTKPAAWGWADLEAAVTADVETLARYAAGHNPGALRLLDQPDSRTTHGILTTFHTYMRVVSTLAEAWPDPSAKRFSIHTWLHKPTPYQPLILQHDPGYPDLSRIWIGSLLGLLASAVGSPSLAESRERRIWLFLDEFPQLPAVQQFPAFLELGRSKGIVVVIGAQDNAQIRAVYGPDQAKAWFGMAGTKIITRINASDTAEDISRIIGDQEIERQVRSATWHGTRNSITESVQRETRRAVTASELGSRLGPTKHGVRVLFVGMGDASYEVELPYIEMRKRREPILPAPWTVAPPPPNGGEPPAPLARLSQDIADRIRRAGE